jgi:hypothetical protein
MPKVIHQETMCCGSKRCVEATVLDDGSVVLSDDDSENGSFGTIKLRPEVANRLLEILKTYKE